MYITPKHKPQTHHEKIDGFAVIKMQHIAQRVAKYFKRHVRKPIPCPTVCVCECVRVCGEWVRECVCVNVQTRVVEHRHTRSNKGLAPFSA